MEAFSLSMQKGGTLQKKNIPTNASCLPSKNQSLPAEGFGQDSEHSLHEFSVGNGKIWQTLGADLPGFPFFALSACPNYIQTPREKQKHTPHLQDVSPIKSGDFPTCHSFFFPGGGVFFFWRYSTVY